jgi:hypothetical protein
MRFLPGAVAVAVAALLSVFVSLDVCAASLCGGTGYASVMYSLGKLRAGAAVVGSELFSDWSRCRNFLAEVIIRAACLRKRESILVFVAMVVIVCL